MNEDTLSTTFACLLFGSAMWPIIVQQQASSAETSAFTVRVSFHYTKYALSHFN
jgi:hypothetical protein